MCEVQEALDETKAGEIGRKVKGEKGNEDQKTWREGQRTEKKQERGLQRRRKRRISVRPKREARQRGERKGNGRDQLSQEEIRRKSHTGNEAVEGVTKRRRRMRRRGARDSGRTQKCNEATWESPRIVKKRTKMVEVDGRMAGIGYDRRNPEYAGVCSAGRESDEGVRRLGGPEEEEADRGREGQRWGGLGSRRLRRSGERGSPCRSPL